MDFTFDDVKITEESCIPPRVKRTIDLLESLPDGKIISTRRVAQLLNTSEIHGLTAHPSLLDFREFKKGGRKIAWANRATIKAYREWKNNDRTGRNDAGRDSTGAPAES